MCLKEEPEDILQTFQFMSDGNTLYWLYSLQTQDTITHPVNGDKIKQYPLILHAIHLKVSARAHLLLLLLLPTALCVCACVCVQSEDGKLYLELGRKVLIQRSGGEGDKSDLMKVLVRSSPSYSSTALSSLLGITKDDTCEPHAPPLKYRLISHLLFFFFCLAGITSCGLTVRMLQKCCGYTTGSSLVLLAPPPIIGGRGNLFGVQGGQLSKALCLNLCFSLASGKSVTQPDLQPSSQLHCALSKGASMSTMGEPISFLQLAFISPSPSSPSPLQLPATSHQTTVCGRAMTTG